MNIAKELRHLLWCIQGNGDGREEIRGAAGTLNLMILKTLHALGPLH